MLDSLKRAFTAVKQGAVEAGAKSYLNQKIQKFGNVKELQIDPGQRVIAIEAELKGEVSPIQIRVGNYELSGSGDASFITLHRFEASREWLQTVLNDYVAGRPWKIPANVRNLL